MSDQPAALRYVVLHHEGIAEPHFDLMFESAPGSMLLTWRSDTWPVDKSSVFTPLPEHRRDYLDYEGPVSGNRGHVSRIASGNFAIVDNSNRWFKVRLDTGQAIAFDRK